MQRTKSGLIVPEGTVQLKREVLDTSDAKALRRAMRICDRMGIQLGLVCLSPSSSPAWIAGTGSC